MFAKIFFTLSLLVTCLSVSSADVRNIYNRPVQTYQEPQPQPQYSRPQPTYREPETVYEAPKYDFDWSVNDAYSGNDFGHQETRDGDNTRGSYYVLLPDGRKQTVTYYVDGDSGFVAEVTYEGEARYPEPQPNSYQPQRNTYEPPRNQYSA